MIQFKSIYLPCGGTAHFDESAGYGYRCEDCMAVVGSIGQPRNCKDEADFWHGWEQLGGQGWDYQNGRPQEIKHKKE